MVAVVLRIQKHNLRLRILADLRLLDWRIWILLANEIVFVGRCEFVRLDWGISVQIVLGLILAELVQNKRFGPLRRRFHEVIVVLAVGMRWKLKLNEGLVLRSYTVQAIQACLLLRRALQVLVEVRFQKTLRLNFKLLQISIEACLRLASLGLSSRRLDWQWSSRKRL